MKPKKQLLLFFLTIILILLAIELLYHFYPIATNMTETRKMQIENNPKIAKVQNALFGSSVTLGIGHGPMKYPNTFNGSTIAATTLFGQYFLFLKLADKNHHLKSVYFSYVPHMLSMNVVDYENKRVVRAFNRAFKEERFVEILRNVKPSYSTNSDYFIDRRFYLKSLTSILEKKLTPSKSRPKKKEMHSAEAADRQPEDQGIDRERKLQDKIGRLAKRERKRTLEKEYALLLELIENYRTTHPSVNFTFVLEPVAVTKYRAFVQSPAYSEFTKLLRKHRFYYIDTNKIVEFKDSYFGDVLHLKGSARPLYEKIILEYLADKQDVKEGKSEF